jgi:AcrR family transcriptional regulator
MVQTKKASVQDAIIKSAANLFQAQGYSNTPMAAIARHAGVAVSNIYVYFGSKIALFYAVYEPWLECQFDRMLVDVRAQTAARAAVERLLEWIWVRIPSSDNYFSNNLMEAVSTAGADAAYSSALLYRCRARIADLLIEIGDGRLSAADAADIAMLIMMAFDGFAMKVRVSVEPPSGAVLAQFAVMVMGRFQSDASAPPRPRAAVGATKRIAKSHV